MFQLILQHKITNYMQCHALQLYSGSAKLKPVTGFSFSACGQLKQTQLQYFDFLAMYCIAALSQ